MKPMFFLSKEDIQMKKITFIMVLLLTIILVSCVSVKPKYNADGSPIWTTNTPVSDDDYYYGVGSANLKLKQASSLRAEALAKQNITTQVSKDVVNSIEEYNSKNNLKDSMYFKNFSSEVSSFSINSAKVKETYIAKDGTTFILCELEKKTVKEAYKEEAKKIEKLSDTAKEEVNCLLDSLGIV